MKKLITIFAILICIFGTSISIADAEDEVINSQMDSFNISNFIDEANKYSNDILKDIDIQELLNNAIKGELDTNQLLKNIFPLLGTEIKEALKVMGSILIIVLIHSVLKSISDNLNNKSVAQITYYVQYILIATVIMTNFSSIITLTKEAVGNMISFIQLLFPLLMTLMLASGSVVSVNLVQPIILFIINLISNIFQSIIIPIILVGTALAIVSKISDRIQIDKLSKFLKSSSVWVIGILLTIFVGVLSIEGTLGSSVDGITAKTAKAAVSSFIPVVGKVLGDAVDTVIGCSAILKNAIGIVGVIVVIAICITPILKLAIITIIYHLTAALCEPIADSKIVSLITQMADTFKILLAILCSISVMLIIGITLVINISNTGLMYR
ncbi:stage III sporulation protein AE [Clostridium sp. CAG:354]|jgi:stage III sporulation protein AE|nr:stage III sporulation protein AE [Clostridium sp.]MBS5863252.1 stage III sporulation protein AE [Clostridium sp.]MEE0269295.1 stage III sporulation protein AE [Clostridia bacterium]CDE10183.1 stage III sporulation protein AE [Clostridium sp. CAG:354]